MVNKEMNNYLPSAEKLRHLHCAQMVWTLANDYGQEQLKIHSNVSSTSRLLIWPITELNCCPLLDPLLLF